MSENVTMEKLTYTRKEAAAAIGVGTTTLDALLRREINPLPSVKIGHKVLIPADMLRAWLANSATIGAR